MLNIAIREDTLADMTLLKVYISRYMGGVPFSLKTYFDGERLLSDLPDNALQVTHTPSLRAAAKQSSTFCADLNVLSGLPRRYAPRKDDS